MMVGRGCEEKSFLGWKSLLWCNFTLKWVVAPQSPSTCLKNSPLCKIKRGPFQHHHQGDSMMLFMAWQALTLLTARVSS